MVKKISFENLWYIKFSALVVPDLLKALAILSAAIVRRSAVEGKN